MHELKRNQALRNAQKQERKEAKWKDKKKKKNVSVCLDK